MNQTGWAALITAVIAGIASLIGVYIRLYMAIDGAGKAKHKQTVDDYRDLLDRMHQITEIFRQEISSEKQEARQEVERVRLLAREEIGRQRTSFNDKLTEVCRDFTATLKAERAASRRDSQEFRSTIAAMAAANTEEHMAIVNSLNELREQITESRQ